MRKYSLAALIAVFLSLTVGCGGVAANSRSQQNVGEQDSNQNSQDAPPPSNQNSALPTPPSNAKVIPHIERTGHWSSCNAKNCSGGSGNGEYWIAENQSSPSLSGSSFQLHNSGAWSNALWWNKFGPRDDATNFLWDFSFQVDDASTDAAQALEFDVFQFLDGYNYMMGSQCDYGAGLWEVWDEANGHWVRTKVACPKFSPGVWHHVQWYTKRDPATARYTFVTLVVDGAAYSINQTYSAKNVGWSKNIGVQYQLDVNATGKGYQEWVDQVSLTVW